MAYLQQSGFLPLETLFAADYDSPYYSSWEHAGGFYAQAWALVHFWYCGDTELPKGAAMKFLQVAADRKKAATTDLRAHFRACFGMDYPQMLRLLEDYVAKGTYRYLRQPPPQIDPPASYAMRAVPLEEMQLRLTELSLRVHHSAMANFTLLDAVAKGLKDTRVLEALGTFALFEQDPARARERWEQALEAGSTNSAVQREAAKWTVHGWLREFSPSFRLSAERAEQWRARLLRAIAQEPRQTAAYESLAWVEAVAETPTPANVALVQEKLPTLRQKYRTVFALALLNLRAGRADEAKAQLASLELLEVDPAAEQAVETMRARLEGRPARLILGIPQAK
jgi:hypothetical protein